MNLDELVCIRLVINTQTSVMCSVEKYKAVYMGGE